MRPKHNQIAALVKVSLACVCALILVGMLVSLFMLPKQPLPRAWLQGNWMVTDLRGPPDGDAVRYMISIDSQGNFVNNDGAKLRFKSRGSWISVYVGVDKPVLAKDGLASYVTKSLSLLFSDDQHGFDLVSTTSADENKIMLALPGEPPFKMMTRIEDR